jgi:hypothetical protein
VQEENRRLDLQDTLEDAREELSRERAARKALTAQLKKERKWREKCLHLTQGVVEMKSEGDLSGASAETPQVSSPNPIPQHLDPASKAYLQAVEEYIQAEGGAQYDGSTPPHNRQRGPPHPHQHPAGHPGHPGHPAHAALEEERRKNKLLTLELLRQRTLMNAPASVPVMGATPRDYDVYSNLSSPTHHAGGGLGTPHTQSTSPYFPLGSPVAAAGAAAYGRAVNDREVAALRVAVERHDIERVLDAEIGVERDVEVSAPWCEEGGEEGRRGGREC